MKRRPCFILDLLQAYIARDNTALLALTRFLWFILHSYGKQFNQIALKKYMVITRREVRLPESNSKQKILTELKHKRMVWITEDKKHNETAHRIFIYNKKPKFSFGVIWIAQLQNRMFIL